MAFSLIDLGEKQNFKDKKKLDIIKNLRKELVILKPDKGNGIVLLNANDYYNGVEKLFQDKLKFKQILEEPTPSRRTPVQRYLKMLNKRGEITNPLMQPRELAESFLKPIKMMITFYLTGCCFTIQKHTNKKNCQYHP